MHEAETTESARNRTIVFGLMLITGGLVLWFHGRSVFSFFGLWPLALVGLGVLRTLGAHCRHQLRDGLWFLALGLWFAANEFTRLRYHDSWPVLVIIVGALISWQAVDPVAPCPACGEGHHD